MNKLAEIDGKHVKIDFTEQECAALGVLAEMGGAMLRDMRGQIGQRQAELIRVALNTVRYKLNIAASLLNPAAIVTDARVLPFDKPM